LDVKPAKKCAVLSDDFGQGVTLRAARIAQESQEHRSMCLSGGQQGYRANHIICPALGSQGLRQSVYGRPVEPNGVAHRVLRALVVLVQVEQRCEGPL
jgi:hypothetical protein